MNAWFNYTLPFGLAIVCLLLSAPAEAKASNSISKQDRRLCLEARRDATMRPGDLSVQRQVHSERCQKLYQWEGIRLRVKTFRSKYGKGWCAKAKKLERAFKKRKKPLPLFLRELTRAPECQLSVGQTRRTL
uniref:YARHG domain-containing protein n=1 Tax=Magnetococcus massalia (strain MO-1) TaxID=451514 RepID=A0A1S7LD94_MAGMO|nr:Exported protein of unknown function [Candidatus Magnetococcus massalia]